MRIFVNGRSLRCYNGTIRRFWNGLRPPDGRRADPNPVARHRRHGRHAERAHRSPQGLRRARLRLYTNYEAPRGPAPRNAWPRSISTGRVGRQARARRHRDSKPTEADAYFARAAGQRIGAWASQQSRPSITPPGEGGCRPTRPNRPRRNRGRGTGRASAWHPAIEFWSAGTFRLHDRIVSAAPARAGEDAPLSLTGGLFLLAVLGKHRRLLADGRSISAASAAPASDEVFVAGIDALRLLDLQAARSRSRTSPAVSAASSGENPKPRSAASPNAIADSKVSRIS